MNLTAAEIKAFVPTRDLELSLRFYEALGFEAASRMEDLAYMRHGETSFLLQLFDDAHFSSNFMMHFLVENVNDWHAFVQSEGIPERFGVQVGPLVDQPWRMRDFKLSDPFGVLWIIAQNT
ncbi:VOC family protein [Massilia sp. MB5]|uniref:VOC family protein n=1 Tax=unclassified Massilia TaxID=2609279 RepID=UPI00067A7626|nr:MULTISPECIES: VOC family protein [unclassified Massilia]AKU21560.1 glyoxalase [Massilia sp. NR 4-1]UMR28844.1 VOC family protein [Massilia sp. MB5]